MFDKFYSAYPRKEAKKDAMKAWTQITPAQQQQAIESLPKHVERWTMLETSKHHIPLPASWLRGWRFDDEIEIPEAKKSKVIEPAWWSSNEGMLAKGLELGTCPRPGEDWFSFKNRLNNLIKQSA